MKQKITIEVRRKGAWSRAHDSCVCCQTTTLKHLSKGLCQACYARTYRDAMKSRKLKGEVPIMKIECEKKEWQFLCTLLQHGPYNTTEVYDDENFQTEVWNSKDGERVLKIEGTITDYCKQEDGKVD